MFLDSLLYSGLILAIIGAVLCYLNGDQRWTTTAIVLALIYGVVISMLAS